MKRVLIAVAALLISTGLPAQNKNAGFRSGIVVTAGINIPIMCYAGKDAAGPTAGFARTGYAVGLGYTWFATGNAGIRTQLTYTQNRAGYGQVKAVAGENHYRLWGLMAGPVVYSKKDQPWVVLFSPLAGITRVRLPALASDTKTILEAQNRFCFSWGGNLALQYNFSGHHFIRLQSGHLNMKPRLTASSADAKTEQHIVLMTVDAGMGWKW